MVISGGGPAGAKCAEVAARAGLKVALLERNSSWRKPCGGGLPYHVMRDFPETNQVPGQEIGQNVMFSATQKKLEIPSKHKGRVVDRLVFDSFLRKRAVEAGAEFLDNTFSEDLKIAESEGVIVYARTKEGTQKIRGKLLIIADGVGSRLAVKAGLRAPWTKQQLDLVHCAYLQGPNTFAKDISYFYVLADKFGYGWVFPMQQRGGEDCINIGAGFFGDLPQSSKDVFNDFVNAPNIATHLSPSVKIAWEFSYSIPIGGVMKNLAKDRVMAIGDAAGFVSPMSGEGIYYALWTGKIAAETASASFKTGDFSRSTLNAYKNHPKIRAIAATLQLQKSMGEFMYSKGGNLFDLVLAEAERDNNFRDDLNKLFLAGNISSNNVFARIQQIITRNKAVT